MRKSHHDSQWAGSELDMRMVLRCRCKGTDSVRESEGKSARGQQGSKGDLAVYRRDRSHERTQLQAPTYAEAMLAVPEVPKLHFGKAGYSLALSAFRTPPTFRCYTKTSLTSACGWESRCHLHHSLSGGTSRRRLRELPIRF